MEQIAEEGIDFQLFGVPHHCHKAYIICIGYLLVTADHALRQLDKTRVFPFCLRMEQVCCGSFSMGTFVLLLHLRTLVLLFMPFFKIAKQALNPTFVSSLQCLLQSST